MLILIDSFKWKYINIVAGSDSYSRFGGEALQAQAESNGIAIVKAASFTTGSADMSAAIAAVVSGRCRATVVFGHSDDAVHLLKEGRKQGYAGEWIVSESVVSAFQRIEKSLGLDAKDLLPGVFSVAPSSIGTSGGYSRFKKAWLAQQPTATILSGSVVDCSNATDASE